MSTIEAPVLSPAKPYQGQSQHQAIQAAVRKFIDAGLARKRSDFGGSYPEIQVTGRGSVYLGSGVNQVSCDVAEFWYSNRRSSPTDDGKYARKVMTAFIKALEAAGWTVEERPGRWGGEQHHVAYGPGLKEWAAKAREQRRLDIERQAERDRQATLDRATMTRVLKELGIEGKYVDAGRYTESSVSLRLSDLVKIKALVQAAFEAGVKVGQHPLEHLGVEQEFEQFLGAQLA